MMTHLLDNIVWHTLAGLHARFSIGTNEARRYVAGFPPVVGFSDLDHPNLDALAQYVAPGEHLYCDGWAGAAPAEWRIHAESALCKLIWDAPMPAAEEMPEAVRLGPQHVQAALELATQMRPGPFDLRTIELGEYFGVFDGPRLAAMAGVRLCAGGWCEITGVCTHPDYQGRGLAKRLVIHLIRRRMGRGETPFLRVLRDSGGAYSLYQRMGFRDYRESVARVFSRC